MKFDKKKDQAPMFRYNPINLSKKDIELSYKIGEETIPWSEKLIQLSEITPNDMCITKLEYINNAFNISAISKIHKNQKDQKIINNLFKCCFLSIKCFK